MSVTERAMPYAERLLDDRELQRDLRDAVKALRSSLGRAQAKRRKPSRLAGDRRFKRNAKRAAESLHEAAIRFQEPPKRHRGRKLLVIAVVLGAGAFAARKAIDQGGQPLGA